jgi:tyrosyl-tRNA synthetase
MTRYVNAELKILFTFEVDESIKDEDFTEFLKTCTKMITNDIQKISNNKIKCATNLNDAIKKQVPNKFSVTIDENSLKEYHDKISDRTSEQ